ncbi:hypothetical protein G6514_004717 [Epicoccum nigrum]|nr:hypothetical protein G6514_004717 [Epicoccum nigrum]
MKAVYISRFTHNLSDITPSDTPTPNPTGKQTVHVQITHAAVTHVDLLYAQGLHQNNKRHVTPPFILGTEFAGIVISAPSSSTFRPGTRVFGGGLGAFAEQICATEDSVRRVPQQWSNAEACAVGASGAVSYGALHGVAHLQAGESVCVLGASGGLGVMAVQIAKARGAHVIAVVGSDVKADVVRRIGADEVVSYTEPHWEDAVRDKSPGARGVDVVYDAVGAVESGIKCLKYRGRLVIVGFAAREGKMENVRANRILLKSAMRFGEDGRHDPQRTKDVWDGFMQLVDGRSIKPVIYDAEYRGLEAMSRALEDAKEHRAWGRAVLRINEEAEEAVRKKTASKL